MTALRRQPDDPGTACQLLKFTDDGGGRTLIFMGSRQIGEINLSSWLRANIYRVTIHLGTRPLRAIGSNLEQAKVFANQEVLEFFADTPVKLEVSA